MTETTIPVSVYAEMTPNPAVMKFVANRRLVDVDSIEFKNIEEASPSPLAVRLFHFPFVKEVFMSGNYIALSKYNVVEWDDITLELRTLIRDWVAEGKAVLNAIPEPATGNDSTPETMENPTPEGEIEQRIHAILEEYIRPAVARDGRRYPW